MDIGTVRGGEAEVPWYVLFVEGGCGGFQNNEQLCEGRRQEANKVEVRSRGSKRDQGRNEAVLVRATKGLAVGEDGRALDLLVGFFFSMYDLSLIHI